MRLEDAWRPIDEVAGTGVDTFVYGLSRDDGLFYPSKVGMPFGESRGPAEKDLAAYENINAHRNHPACSSRTPQFPRCYLTVGLFCISL